MENSTPKRERIPAKKARIIDITNGKFFPGSRETMQSAYVITPFGEKLSRINILATITEKFSSENSKYSSITVDDTTNTIRAKVFGADTQMFENVKKGDAVVIIGKVKEYQTEIYISAEFIRHIPRQQSNYENLRRLELLNNLNEKKKIIDNLRKFKNRMSEEALKKYAEDNDFGDDVLEIVMEGKDIDYKPQILEIISQLDTDSTGVEIMKIFEQAKEVENLPDIIIEQTVDQLLSEGYLFEPNPGKFKIIRE